MGDNNSLYNNKIKKLKNLAERYEKLGFKIIPLEGKRPFWKGWDDPKLWNDGTYNNELTLRTVERNPNLNIGIPTGEISGIIAIDVDQPDLLGWNPEPAIKKGALAHTTSKALRLILRSTNLEVLTFSKKLTKKWTQLTEEEREKAINREKYEKVFRELKEKLEKGEITQEEFNRKVPTVTIVEILGQGRQFMAPSSIHPEAGVELKWLTPLPDSPEKILTINSVEELYALLLECCERKDLIDELFKDYFKQKAKEDTGAKTDKEADTILEEWLEIILKHLDVVKETDTYILCRCPFHPPDEHPSFTIYKNTKLAIDFHDGSIYKLKELAEKLGIELPTRRKEKKNEAWVSLKFTYERTITDENGNEKTETLEFDFGWLKIEKSTNGKVLVSIHDKDGKCVFSPRQFSLDFIYSDRAINKIFKNIKEKLGDEIFEEFLNTVQKRIRKALFKLLKSDEEAEGIRVESEHDEEVKLSDVLNIDLKLLEVFEIKSLDDALEIASKLFVITPYGGVETDHARIAEFLLERFVFKTILESEEILIYEEGVHKPNGERKVKELVQLLLKGYGLEYLATKHLIEEIVDYIKRSTYTPIEDFRKFDELELVNLKNGVLDLRTMTLKPHSPEYLFLWKLPVEYNPDADCPRIRKFLTEIVDDKDVWTLLKMVAYILMLKQPFKVAFYLYGSGSNGKTTFLNLVAELLGKDNISAVPLHQLETHRFATWQLFGKLANISAETPNEKIHELRVFKQITGYDPIYIEKKFKDGFTTYLRAKLIFAGNRLPEIENLDDATIRRWILIKFPNVFRQNPKLFNELTTPTELAGLFNLVLEAYRKLKEEGFETIDVEENRRTWLRFSNPLLAFVYEMIEVDDDAETERDAIWEAYYRWCQSNSVQFEFHGEGAKKVFFKKFYGVLEQLGIKYDLVRKNDGIRRWYVIKGIKLKEFNENETTENNNDGNDNPPNFSIEGAMGVQSPSEALLDEIFDDENNPNEIEQDEATDLEEDGNKDTKTEESEKGEKSLHYVKIKILQEIPEFYGVDGVVYGKFKPGDVVEIPVLNAIPFLKHGAGEIVDSEINRFYDVWKDGRVTFYKCKRCGTKFLSKTDALSHLLPCFEHPEWMERRREKERMQSTQKQLDGGDN